jgi:hypothetical protein
VINEAASVGFGRGADDYVAARPSYPSGVFDLLAAPPYRHHRDADWEGLVDADGGYEAYTEDWFPNWQDASVDVVVGRTASTSWISALPDDRREAVLDDVRALLARHPATRGRDRFWFPHDTVVQWCRRR